MIINNDCAREILKALSKIKIKDTLVLIEFMNEHPEFSEEEVVDATIYLIKSEYVILNNVRYADDNIDVDKYTRIKLLLRWRDIMPYSLYDDKVWEEVKDKIDISKYNFKSIVDMLIKKEIAELNKIFGIDNCINANGR